jgi:hypothetical protein
MTARNGFGADAPKIATREELLRLRQQRSTPEAKPHLRPDSSVTPQVAKMEAQTKEQRIRYLESRLDRAGKQAETDHTFSRLEGYAQTDFDRSS